MISENTLGEILRRRRRERKLTLQQLADDCGVSRAAISKTERGDSGASTPVLGKLAEALDLSISQLVGGRQRDQDTHIPAVEQPVFRESGTGFERQN
jgi:transcriptional regulator with XRE-family HTH domain